MAIRNLILTRENTERAFEELQQQWQEMAGVVNDTINHISADKTGALNIDATTLTFNDSKDSASGWRDLIGEIVVRGTPGASTPSWAAYAGTTIFQYQFSNATTQEIWVNFHMQHDYKPGSDLYLHIHWSQTTVDSGGTAGVPGQAKWYFDVLYAKGHQQAAFSNSVITTSITQTASGTVRTHMIGEVQLSASSPSAAQLDSDNLEVDGVIMVRAYRNPGDADDTLNVTPFVHYVDIHYQTDRVNTINKAPNFYA
jgi:hypothetical protein